MIENLSKKGKIAEFVVLLIALVALGLSIASVAKPCKSHFANSVCSKSCGKDYSGDTCEDDQDCGPCAMGLDPQSDCPPGNCGCGSDDPGDEPLCYKSHNQTDCESKPKCIWSEYIDYKNNHIHKCGYKGNGETCSESSLCYDITQGKNQCQDGSCPGTSVCTQTGFNKEFYCPNEVSTHTKHHSTGFKPGDTRIIPDGQQCDNKIPEVHGMHCNIGSTCDPYTPDNLGGYSPTCQKTDVAHNNYHKAHNSSGFNQKKNRNIIPVSIEKNVSTPTSSPSPSPPSPGPSPGPGHGSDSQLPLILGLLGGGVVLSVIILFIFLSMKKTNKIKLN